MVQRDKLLLVARTLGTRGTNFINFKRMKTETTSELPGGFEHETPGLVI